MVIRVKRFAIETTVFLLFSNKTEITLILLELSWH